MLDLLITSIFTAIDKDEQGKDIDASEQYNENLKVHQPWFKSDHSTSYSMLSCMHDDFLGELECYTTAKGMWTLLKIKFSQTFTTRLHNIRLKWMQYTIGSNWSICEHLQIMSGVVQDLKVTGHDVFEEEHAINMIRASLIKMNIRWVLNSFWCIMRTFRPLRWF